MPLLLLRFVEDDPGGALEVQRSHVAACSNRFSGSELNQLSIQPPEVSRQGFAIVGPEGGQPRIALEDVVRPGLAEGALKNVGHMLRGHALAQTELRRFGQTLPSQARDCAHVRVPLPNIINGHSQSREQGPRRFKGAAQLLANLVHPLLFEQRRDVADTPGPPPEREDQRGLIHRHRSQLRGALG